MLCMKSKGLGQLYWLNLHIWVDIEMYEMQNINFLYKELWNGLQKLCTASIAKLTTQG